MVYIPDKRCPICNEVISNPICPECLNREIRDWLLDKDIELFGEEAQIGSTQCIICRKEFNICPSCYTSEIYDIIKKKYAYLEKEFKQYFNFQLRVRQEE